MYKVLQVVNIVEMKNVRVAMYAKSVLHYIASVIPEL